jgi:cell division initiation protein
LNLHDITGKKFEKSAFGFKPEDVEHHLQKVADYVESLEGEKQVLEKKIQILAEKIEEYRKDENSIREALVGAQRLSQNVVNESNDKAETILSEASKKAEEILKSAQEKADKVVGNTKSQIEKEEKTLLKMKKEVSSFKSKLLSIYKAHLDLVTALPEVEEQKEPEQAQAESPAQEEKPQEASDEIKEEPKEEVSKEEQPSSVKEKTPFIVTIGDSNTKREPEKTFESKFGELKFGKNFKRD